MKPRKIEVEEKPREPSIEELTLGTVKTAIDEMKRAIDALASQPPAPAPVLNVPDNTGAVVDAIDGVSASLDDLKKKDKSAEIIGMLTKFISTVDGRPVNIDLHESEKIINLTVKEAPRPVLKSVRPIRDNYGTITQYDFDWSTE